MCQCTYCRDVYVGLICLRVIYLPKDRHVILEISGEIYLEYVAFPCFPVGVVATQFTDPHLDSFCFSSAIFSFRARQNHRTHSRGTIYHNTKALSHLMKTVSTPAAVAVSLQQQVLGILYHSLYLFFKSQYFTKSSNYDYFSLGCMKKKQLYLTSCCMSCSQIGNT